jgi:DNA uptake protein ComE-like DNA-binding protein
LIAAVIVLAALLSTPVTAAEKKVDLNSASLSELEALPGVGAATAKKIVDHRPYSSVNDLTKAGVPESTIAKIRGLVKAGRAAREEKTARQEKKEERAVAKAEKRETKEEKKAEKAAIKSGEKVDVNSASQGELEALPGVGAATAKKIVANRPYSSVADLSRAGVSASTIDKIRGKVTVGRAPRAERAAERPSERATSREPAAKEERAPAPRSARASEIRSESPVSYQPPPSRGMVWVNLDTKIYHREGDRWYGRTVHGKYMTEAEAIREGDRVSHQKGEPEKP